MVQKRYTPSPARGVQKWVTTNIIIYVLACFLALITSLLKSCKLGIDYHDECEWASGACATWKFNAAILEDLTTKMTRVHNTG